MEKKIKVEKDIPFDCSSTDETEPDEPFTKRAKTILQDVEWNEMKKEIFTSMENNKDQEMELNVKDKQKESYSELKEHLVEDFNQLENEIKTLKKAEAILEYFQELTQESDSDEELLVEDDQ